MGRVTRGPVGASSRSFTQMPTSGKVDHQQHEVCPIHHAGDHSPEQGGVSWFHHQRTGNDPVDGHGADHQGHHRVGGMPSVSRRNERAPARPAFVRRNSGPATPSMAGPAAESGEDPWPASSLQRGTRAYGGPAPRRLHGEDCRARCPPGVPPPRWEPPRPLRFVRDRARRRPMGRLRQRARLLRRLQVC